MPVLSSQPHAVTVFMDRARVTRRGRIALPGGMHRLEFSDLPNALDPASLRVAARGTSPTKLLGVECKKRFHKETPVARVRELEASLEALGDEESVDNDLTGTLAKQLAHLDGLAESTRVFAYGIANGKSTIEQQKALVAFVATERDGVQDRIRAISLRRRERSRRTELLQKELGQILGSKAKERYFATVEVSLEQGGDVEVDLTYVVTGAIWKPLYDIRLQADELTATYLGEVKQNTGEDWSGVELALSTARPALATAIPRLEAWHLHMRPSYVVAAAAAPPPMVAKSMRSRASSADMTMHSLPDAAWEAPMEVAEVETANVQESQGNVTYQIPGGVDIPSDDSPHKVTIGNFPLRPVIDFVGVPKLEPVVFRRAKAVNNTAFTLLPGHAQLFLGDDFLGAADVPMTAPGQSLQLAFGVDDRLRAERGMTKRELSKTFLGGRRRIQYAYEIRLWNHTKSRQTLTIVDHIPLPQHEEIKVSLDSVDPKPDRQDKLNILIWKLNLEANAQQKIRYEFTVEYPKEQHIQGL